MTKKLLKALVASNDECNTPLARALREALAKRGGGA